ncbi:hypothetical protein GCM10009837_06960 [Streptomyces durmitorensis]|uniref:Uncharacterized protein n=1 Tax=Streptomyces durmitorensis TaxID=319947 RepID=A0ABY4PN02_9ACTN|nr:hypothetical protein [Streptomyces durmitorensis]UQT54408.1 hypothetical protein M4V62_04500 [Streptomyces durmitorensis]
MTAGWAAEPSGPSDVDLIENPPPTVAADVRGQVSGYDLEHAEIVDTGEWL